MTHFRRYVKPFPHEKWGSSCGSFNQANGAEASNGVKPG
jgi:hypothetical protein